METLKEHWGRPPLTLATVDGSFHVGSDGHFKVTSVDTAVLDSYHLMFVCPSTLGIVTSYCLDDSVNIGRPNYNSLSKVQCANTYILVGPVICCCFSSDKNGRQKTVCPHMGMVEWLAEFISSKVCRLNT